VFEEKNKHLMGLEQHEEQELSL